MEIFRPLTSRTGRCWVWAVLLCYTLWGLCFKHKSVCCSLKQMYWNLLLAYFLFSKVMQKVWDIFINHKGDTAGWSHSNQIGSNAFVKSADAFFPKGGRDTSQQHVINTGHTKSRQVSPTFAWVWTSHANNALKEYNSYAIHVTYKLMEEEGKGRCCLFGESLTWFTRMCCWSLADLRQALDCQEWWFRPIILVPGRETEAGDSYKSEVSDAALD